MVGGSTACCCGPLLQPAVLLLTGVLRRAVPCCARDVHAAAVIGILPFVREMLMLGCEVVMVANSLPAINDITAAELRRYVSTWVRAQKHNIAAALAVAVVRSAVLHSYRPCY